MRKQPVSGIKSRSLKDKPPVDLISFENLGATRLLNDFLSKKDSIATFFGDLPFTENPNELISQLTCSYPQSIRDAIVPLLLEQNRMWGGPSETLQNIELLRDPDSVIVITGHQLSLFGGPLFTVYKLLTVILIAEKLNKEYNIKVLPFFWMADEDHDLPEVSEYVLQQLQEAPYTPIQKRVDYINEELPVGRIPLSEKITSCLDEISTGLEAPFKDDLTRLLRDTYTPSSTFKDAFARLLLKWFGSRGIILIGGDDPELKKIAKPVFQMAIEQSEELYSDLKTQSDALTKAGYHQQVQFDQSHLFRFTEEGKRVKLKVEGSDWQLLNRKIQQDELLQQLDEKPDSFSPGVLLRLAMQSHLLPVLKVVGGPAEIAYAAQCKPIFDRFKIPMPQFQARYSATLLEPNVKRNLDRLHFSVPDYRKRIEDLVKEWLNRHSNSTKASLFALWKTDLQELFDRYSPDVSAVDSTLEASSERAHSIMNNSLDQLQRKVIRAQKRQHEVELMRIRMVKEALFPANTPQERLISAFSLYAHHGPELWNTVEEAFRQTNPDYHLLISL